MLWRNCGKPLNGVIFNLMKSAKLNYKAAIRKSKNQAEHVISMELQNCLFNKSYDAFWKTVKGKFPGKVNCNPFSVDGITNSKDISNVFAKKFSEVFQVNNSSMDI